MIGLIFKKLQKIIVIHSKLILDLLLLAGKFVNIHRAYIGIKFGFFPDQIFIDA